jgi:hypothetical protein
VRITSFLNQSSVLPARLRTQHSGCNEATTTDARHPDCMAAVRRYCSRRGFPAGLMQELNSPNNVFGVGCLASEDTSYGAVPITTLTSHHAGCTSINQSQSADCIAASHRYCVSQGFDVGVPQEVGNAQGQSVLHVACFNATEYGDVAISTLKSFHSGCDRTTRAQHSHCTSASHRYCQSRGAEGGYVQEVGNNVFGVACFDFARYGDVRVN